MGEPEFLRTLGWMIVLPAVLLVVARRLSVPSIVLFIVAGLILGPITGIIDLTAAFGAHHAGGVSGAIALMSELGIALLLFMVGLELSLERIKDVGKVAAVAGMVQVAVTATIGYGLAWAFGFSTVEAAMLAMALTFSSTVVVVKLVGQRKETDTLHGRIAVGVLLVQDVVVIIALTFVAGMGGESSAGDSVALDLAKAFGGMALMLVGSLLASRYLLPRPFKWAARRPEMLLMWSLALCFTYVVAALALSLSPEIGAFLAGMSLAQLHCAHDLTRRLQALMNFFIAIFFVTLGAQMQLAEAGSQLVRALSLAVFVMAIKPVVLMLVIAKLGYSQETAFKSGVMLAQISEFSFILAAGGMSAGLIGEDILAVIAIVGLTTIVISAYLTIFLDPFYEFVARTGVLRVLKAPVPEGTKSLEGASGHAVVIGMNTLGREIVTRLAERGHDVVAIDTDASKLVGLEARTIVGNVEYVQVLEEANYDQAHLIVSALRIEDTNNLIAYHARQAGVACAIHGFDENVLDDLEALDVDHIINSKNLGVTRLIERVQELEVSR